MASSPPKEGGVVTSRTHKEDVLEDGTKVMKEIIVETFPDGSTCKRTITRRMGVKSTKEQTVGRPTVELRFRNLKCCCCFIPCGDWFGKKEKDEEEEEEDKENDGEGENNEEETKEETKEEEKTEERILREEVSSLSV